MTQCEMIKRHLETFGAITTYEAFQEYGITRLSARIYDLRNTDGLLIDNERKTDKNRFGEPIHYDVYKLRKEEKANGSNGI